MVLKQKRVAVVGAGVSGITTAKHLRAAGLDVVVYERSSAAGGVWVYDERKPPEPTYPSIRPSVADFSVVTADVSNEQGQRDTTEQKNGFAEDLELLHAPPGPAYDGLVNNISTVLQELKGHPWKTGTEDFIGVRLIGEYLQSYSRTFGIDSVTRYNTRVESLRKHDRKWQLRSTTLIKNDSGIRRESQTEEYDAVVVASGHYHASRVPDIPGLKEWKRQWPSKVQHSKGYRKPDDFKDQNVLLIGAGVSSTDIAREISHTAKNIYQSSRGGAFDLPEEFLPLETKRVGEVSSFEPPSVGKSDQGSVTLVDGIVLENIDRVIICTGYHFALPFLTQFHEDLTPVDEASETVLVTNGTQVHNLHHDIFYIPDPTLAFVGIPFYGATFTLFEFQAIAVSAVFSNSAWLPSREEMQTLYRQKVETKGYGRPFHSVLGKEIEYVKELIDWVNSHAEKTGGKKFEAHSEAWVAESELRAAKIKKMFEVKERVLSTE